MQVAAKLARIKFVTHERVNLLARSLPAESQPAALRAALQSMQHHRGLSGGVVLIDFTISDALLREVAAAVADGWRCFAFEDVQWPQVTGNTHKHNIEGCSR